MHKKVIFLLSGILAVFCLLACASGASGIKAGGLSVEEADDVTPDFEVFPQLGHVSKICRIAYSPNGLNIVTADDKDTVKIWDVESGREVRTLSGHQKIYQIMYSPDGRHILAFVGFKEGKGIIVWDIRNGQVIMEKKVDNYRDNLSYYSSDGKYIITKSGFSVLVLDAKSGEQLRTLKGGYIENFFYNHIGRQILTVDDNNIRIFNLDSGIFLRIISFIYDIGIGDIIISPDGKHFLFCDDSIIAFNIENGQPLWTIQR